jgi:cell division protein FtsB
MAILASIFVILAITLIPAVRATITQQMQIHALRDKIAQQRATVAALQLEKRQWNDPAYVEQQARQRLKFVRVGDKSFTVIDGEAATVPTGGARIAAPAQGPATGVPWYGQLWQSVVIADTATSTAAGLHIPAPRAR